MVASILKAGDIAIIHYNSEDADDPSIAGSQSMDRDTISFVLLAPIGIGTQIFFTDRAWNGTSFAGAGGGEGTFTYTAGADLQAGTVITITTAQLNAAGINLDSGELAQNPSAGETIYAYQGAINAPTTFLYAADVADGNTAFEGSELTNTGLSIANNTAVAIAADNASFAARANNIQIPTLLDSIADPNDWVTNENSPQTPHVTSTNLFTAPGQQIWVAGSGGGSAIMVVNQDGTVGGGTLGYAISHLYQNTSSDGNGTTNTNRFFHPTDVVLDTVNDKFFIVDSDGTQDRLLQGSISQALANPGVAPTMTVLYRETPIVSDGEGLTGVVLDSANGIVYFTRSNVLQKVVYNTAQQTPVTLANFGTDPDTGNPFFANEIAHNPLTGQMFVVSTESFSDFLPPPAPPGTVGTTMFRNTIFQVDNIAPGDTNATGNTITKITWTGVYDETNSGATAAPDPQEFEDSFGKIISVDVNSLTGDIWFTAVQLNGGENGELGGIYRASISGGVATVTLIYQETNATNQNFQYIHIDEDTGRYYVTSSEPGTANQHKLYSGSLLGVGAPTEVATVGNINALGPLGLEIENAPTLTATNLTATGTEAAGNPSGSMPVVTPANNFSATDLDSDASPTAQLAGAQVRISSGFQSGAGHQDVLTINGTQSGTVELGANDISYTYDGTTGAMTLTGIQTFDNYEAALALVRFQANGDNPTNYGAAGSRTLSYSTFDGLLYSDEVNATVTVVGINDAPVNVVPGSDSGAEDTTFVIENIQVSDVDADPATQDITVTLAVTRGTLTVNTGVANGLAAGEVTGNGTGTVVLTGTQNQINTTLANATGLQFTGGTNVNGTVTLTVTTNDQGFNGTDPGLTGTATSEQDSDQFTVTVTAVNDAPVRGGDGTEDAVLISEDQPSAGGQTVNALAGALFSDAADDQDAFPGGSSPNAFAGIAVHVNNSNANGQWQYSTDGTIWNDIGAASLAAAKLISAADFVRFNPAANFNGAAPSLAFLLVDDSGGALVSGTTANASVIGGTSRYSDEGVFLNQQVTAVNDAPNVVGGAAVTLTAINEDNTNPPGATVTTLFSGNFSDADDNVGVPSVDTFSGIAITGNAATTEGVWQYFTAGSWTTLPAVATNNAFLVAAADSLRFLPALNFNGAAPLLTVHLVEDVNGGSAVITGTTADLTTTGDPTRFSAALTLGQAVNPVNDVPIFNAATLSVAEFGTNGSANGTVVGTVTASDPDTTLTYSLTDTAGGRFAIDGASGQITVADGTLLDFEQANSHSITVQASGDPGGAISQAFSVTVTDVTPENVTGNGNANTFHGGPDNDRLNGLGGIDNLVGNGGNDALNGGAAADIMAGGQGRDVYFADDTNDQANENPSEGTDTVFASTDYTLGANVEDLVLTGSNPINGTGNGGNNSIYSNTGAGTLTGGDGRDTYVVHNSLITVIELSGLNSGYDTIIADVDFTIAPNVEDLVLIGSNLTGTGSAGANSMYSMGGPNTLIGLGASDSYVIHNSGDQIVELAGVLEGHDTIFTDADFDMATNAANVEDVVLLGTGALSVSGNSGNNSIYGNTGINILSGGDGRDSYVVHNSDTQVIELNGPNSGKDTVIADVSFVLSDNVEDLVLFGPNPIDGTGNGINNSIYGSSGNNILTGLGGSDSFVIRGPAFGHDRITDFDVDFDYVFFSSSLFANSTAMFNATTDDGNGNAVITFNANNTLTLEDVTKAEMQAHSGDFLFI